MATDEQRRKVAAELRELAASRHYVDEFIAADAVGFYRGDAVEGFDSDSLLEVADLIDRPTCRNNGNHNARHFWCSACGYKAWTYDDSGCDPSDFSFCPECGAVVIDED